MDPALVDRTVTHLAGIDDATLPTRSMTIPGVEGSLEARILSTDLRGSSSRLVRLRSGWGSGLVGAFTADVELFVTRGAVQVGPHRLEACDYVAFPQGLLVPPMRVVADGTALLMTSAPVRYDTSAPATTTEVRPGRASEREWEPVPDLPGRHLKHLGPGPAGDVWIEWVEGWDHRDGPWHRHPHHEECFVIAGEMTLRERQDDDTARRVGPGSYFFRPAGTLHAGPGSQCEDTALTFHRSFGDLRTEWVHSPSGDLRTEWVHSPSGESPQGATA